LDHPILTKLERPWKALQASYDNCLIAGIGQVSDAGTGLGVGKVVSVSIVVEDYHKSYGSFVAVRGLSFRVESGEVLGLVGPNGAGKTTTLRALAGILRPTRGRLLLGGHDLAREPVAAKKATAYIPDEPKLFDHRPKAVLLDEPLTGLDPRGIRTMKASILEQAQAGAAFIISSHLLTVVEDLCTTILIMDHGRPLGMGKIADLRRQFLEDAREESLEELFFRLIGSVEPRFRLVDLAQERRRLARLVATRARVANRHAGEVLDPCRRAGGCNCLAVGRLAQPHVRSQ
jgi:ABC-type Na+ transport system ATPase subunit NatA